MKKEELRETIRALDRQYAEQCTETARERRKVLALEKEVETMRANWRPVPITHEWQPRNPQCALCDEPRDSVRHQVGQVRVSLVPQLPEPS